MDFLINTDKLKSMLKRAKVRKDKPEIKRSEPQKDETSYLQYLIDNVFNPLVRGEEIHTGDLDFFRFDNEDLEMLLSYYYQYFYDGTKEWQQLKSVFQIFNDAVPQVKSVGFI